MHPAAVPPSPPPAAPLPWLEPINSFKEVGYALQLDVKLERLAKHDSCCILCGVPMGCCLAG